MTRPDASLPTEAEWTAFKTRIEALRDQAFAAAKDFFPDADVVPSDLIPRKAAVRFCNSHGMQGLLSAIKQRFTADDPYDYVAYHILIGSSVRFHEAPKLDLPGSFSVEKFYEAVIKHPRNVYRTKHAPAMILDGCHQ